ncbi:hypothetical protein PoB_000121000 [Plakobranchus ocellatus]|uniref:Uncharacterized protein n=1 Tax=Plakobranchus ocellatus TaxID=259542 RepID=A0AAV3XV68_9GAST|nr:hypothetical protein PoB_000121000 [Plakobranchus ocellatus]
MPTKFRKFSKEDQVLILLPKKNGNNLNMHYQGPYHIQTVASNNNYVCKIDEEGVHALRPSNRQGQTRQDRRREGTQRLVRQRNQANKPLNHPLPQK